MCVWIVRIPFTSEQGSIESGSHIGSWQAVDLGDEASFEDFKRGRTVPSVSPLVSPVFVSNHLDRVSLGGKPSCEPLATVIEPSSSAYENYFQSQIPSSCASSGSASPNSNSGKFPLPASGTVLPSTSRRERLLEMHSVFMRLYASALATTPAATGNSSTEIPESPSPAIPATDSSPGTTPLSSPSTDESDESGSYGLLSWASNLWSVRAR